MKRDELMIFEKSHLRTRAVVVREGVTNQIAVVANSVRHAEQWCRRLGFTWLNNLNRKTGRHFVQS